MDVTAEHLAAADALWGPHRDHDDAWGRTSLRRPGWHLDLTIHPPAAVGLLAVVLILGTLGALLLRNSAGDTRAAPTAVSPAGTSAPSAAPTGVGGFAELYVATYLGAAGEGTEAMLRPFLADSVSLAGVAPGNLYVARTAALSTEPLADGYWSVLVAAEVMTPVEGGYAPAGLRYYRVGVFADGERFAATALPGQVPAPPQAEMPELALRYLGMPTDDEVTRTAQRFADAFLAGAGGLEEITGPDTGLQPVQPAPFTSTEVRRIGVLPSDGRDGVQLATVEVAGTTADGAVSIGHYVLEVAEHDGLLQVTGLLPGSPLATS